MASKRCIPTRFFKDPDIMNLESKDHQLILVGLVLMADDEGRELAHAKLLSRELDYPQEQIEAALADLATNDLVVLYQVGRHRYYSLTRWGQWQTLSLAKITPSKYPAPPAREDDLPLDGSPETAESSSQHFPEFPRETPGKSAVSQHFPSQGNSSESNSSEGEGERPPHNVVAFPNAKNTHTTTTDSRQKPDEPESQETPGTRESQGIQQAMRQVAEILRLPASDALLRIVGDYQDDPLVRLLGEADAAREYIDDPRRNRRGQRMSPAFFRRWLRREHEDAERRQSQRHATAATGTLGRVGDTSAPPAPAPGTARPILPRSLMHLADQVQLAPTARAPSGPVTPHPQGGQGQ
ncbi:MAG: hypothetical protein E6I80_10325 [Chloroflexi bacterium]|nr:MAG: hypothetical protein E6I80_10325 [Chloroflexota bacterium]